MNREDIMRMAREAGWKDLRDYDSEMHNDFFMGSTDSLVAFAALVASAEREACAKIVESDPSYDWHKFACEAANAIRARGQA